MGIRLTVRSSWSDDGASNLLVYEFDQERVVIGRGAGSDVRLPHAAVSNHHATLRAQGAGWVAIDESSTNGTWVGETRIPPKRPKPLRSGDVVNVGGFALTVTVNVPITDATSVDRTSALARRLVRDLLDPGHEAPPPRLFVLNGPDEGASLEVGEPPLRLSIGRGEECDLALSDADASREHAEIERDLDGVLVRDLGSKNGLEVNGRKVKEKRLKDRDEIAIGGTVLVFEDPADGMLASLAEGPDVPMETPLWKPREEEAAKPETGHDASPPVGAASASAASEPAAAATPSVPSPRRRSSPAADWIIYLLAGAVLALSIAGLVILLQAG
jgi:pSer/pThr/pTyr-binding forkhead associated (FHA) protein